jgi:histone acetyltransferase (RNA polymerase elongator complex component)
MKDIKDWIAGNYTNYQQNHTVALICGASQAAQDRQDIIRFVKDLYMNYTTTDEEQPKLCRHVTC